MDPIIHILVADDEPDIRRIIRILLERRGYAVLEAPNGLAAVDMVREHPETDLVIMDIMMPGLDGVEASRRIRECSPAPILFLTARTQEKDKLAAYQAGGDDYLAKPFSQNELVMKVESLLRRYRVYKGKTAGKYLRQDIVLDEENRRVLKDGEPLELTEKEFAILLFLANHRGHVVAVEQIYEGVWHEKYMPASNNTVMVHIRNLRRKLGDDPQNAEIIKNVWGRGYRLD